MAELIISAEMKLSINGTDFTRYVRDVEIGSPITSFYCADGQLQMVRINYEAMDRAEREDIVGWVQAHRVDPGLVPTLVEIGFDPDADEWRFPVRIRGPKGGICFDLVTGEIPLRIIRRRRQPWLPIPSRGTSILVEKEDGE